MVASLTGMPRVSSDTNGTVVVMRISATGSPANRNARTTRRSPPGPIGSESVQAWATSTPTIVKTQARYGLVCVIYLIPIRKPMLGVNGSVVTSVTTTALSLRSNFRYQTLLRP